MTGVNMCKWKRLNQVRHYYETHIHASNLIIIALIFLEDEDPIMKRVHQLESTGKRIFGLDVVVSTSKLEHTRTGTKYFVYQCTRYVYHPETQLFSPHEFELGDTNADLAKQTEGLTTDEAARRKELIGANFISVYVPNVPMAILREFSSFFYIYQFTVLWLFYYFAYCKWTTIDIDAMDDGWWLMIEL